MTSLGVTSDELAETIEAARDFLRKGGITVPDARDFARAVVHLASSCVVGVACEQHYGSVHGQEAEELRAGVERIISNTSDMSDTAGVSAEEAATVLAGIRKSLIFLLDQIDARDSLAFREATDPKDPQEANECA